MQNTNIIERINIMHNVLEEKYTRNDSVICPPMIKKFFNMSEIDTIMKDYIPSLNYVSRGLYFVPLKCSYSNILYLFDKDKSKSVRKKVNITSVRFRIEKLCVPMFMNYILKKMIFL